MASKTTQLSDVLIPIRDEAGNFRFLEVLNQASKEKHQENRPEGDEAATSIPVKSSSAIPKQDKTSSAQPKIARVEKRDTSNNAPINSTPARFYIDSHDEQEVAQQLVPQGIVTHGTALEKAAQSVAKSIKISVEAELVERLNRIIVSNWKGIRNERKTKEVLMRDKSLGGVGLNDERALELLNAIQKDNPLKDGVTHIPETDPASKLVESQPLTGNAPRQSSPPVLTSSAAPQVAVSDNQVSGASQQPVKDIFDDKSSTINNRPLITEIKNRPQSRVSTDTIHKPNLPLKSTEKVAPVGPVDELEMFTREDFRHLSKDAQEAAQKIYQKIDLLGDESLELKASAIAAWKKSPLYHDYLTIGHKSMEGEHSVEEIISNKKLSDLSMNEFEAISDLNKSLQF